MPRDLVRPRLTVTGSVVSTGRCLVVAAPDGRWAVTGSVHVALKPGDRITVQGPAAAVPPGCTADRAIGAASLTRH
ncbi:MAG: hypothetical protein JWO79_2999 [Actinomycetia bacterium]|jgi:hypothetical protein|nr:hypothetical protein [Actinomycetes bacterium]